MNSPCTLEGTWVGNLSVPSISAEYCISPSPYQPPLRGCHGHYNEWRMIWDFDCCTQVSWTFVPTDNYSQLTSEAVQPEVKSDFKPFDLDKIAQKSVRRFLLCPQDELDKKYQILMDFPTLSALKRISATTWKHFYPKIFLVSKIIFVVVTKIFAYSTSKRAISSTANQNKALTPDFLFLMMTSVFTKYPPDIFSNQSQP